VLLGALILGSINNGLNLLGVSTFWQTITLGTVLVLAVGIDAVLRRHALRARAIVVSEAGSTPSDPVQEAS
jgi:predicted ABC-type sugar transport system permease subunit